MKAVTLVLDREEVVDIYYIFNYVKSCTHNKGMYQKMKVWRKTIANEYSKHDGPLYNFVFKGEDVEILRKSVYIIANNKFVGDDRERSMVGKLSSFFG